MSFNFIPVTLEDEQKEEALSEFVELARDLDTLEILTKDNRFYYVTKNDAIKIWILKALNMQMARYEYRAYSSDYGNEISKLFGRSLKNSLLKSELQRCIREALLVNPYIKEIRNFNFEKNGSSVSATFTVSTVYGEIEQEAEYTTE